jgi:hypothetical protein
MAWYNFGSKKIEASTPAPVDDKAGYFAFSTPFVKIGKGDLTKPYVDVNLTGMKGFIRFGADNLFPQIINQMYYTSPLNGSIIEYKKNAIIGGGYTIEETNNSREKVDLYTFIKRNKFNKEVKNFTRDLIMHNRVAAYIYCDDSGKPYKMKRVSPEKVRIDANKEKAYISEDWLRQTGIEVLPIYDGVNKYKKSVYYYEIDTPGQDFYPIPMYSNAFNWMYLDGESSLLHKSNIQESIYPSLIVKRPKNFKSPEEAYKFHEALTRKKGSDNAGFVWVLTADTKDMLPDVDTIQTSGNDKLFLQTDERMDASICRAHQIDPFIMGIRVSGKLGSGQELEHAYLTFEKNYVMPIREELEYIFNDLLFMFGINQTLTINNYQIVDGEISDKTIENDEDDENLI